MGWVMQGMGSVGKQSNMIGKGGERCWQQGTSINSANKSENEGRENMVGKSATGDQEKCKKEGNGCI